jgi:uncharacterized DUF497 family protein
MKDKGYIDFEWDANKAETNIHKHGLDFKDAARMFYASHTMPVSVIRDNEERYQITGEVEGRVITVVYTQRNGKIRLISARAARSNERKKYADIQVT